MKKYQVLIILQARVGSSRLPNKVLRLLHGVPLLSYSIRRLKAINSQYQVIVATSDSHKDDPVESLAKKENVLCFRGEEEDVLDRYYQAARKYKADYIVRATGDNPLVDTEEAGRVVESIIKKNVDYVSGIEEVNGLKLPVGIGVEAFSFNVLEKSWKNGKEPHHREHVNEYIHENAKKYNIILQPCLKKNHCPGLRLTVDTYEDFLHVEKVVVAFNKGVTQIKVDEIIDWYKKENGHNNSP